MWILKNKAFHHWTKKLRINDSVLINAIEEIKTGLYEANLGGYIYKKRIALSGRGKRGGARTIVAFKLIDRAIFIYGYAKNERPNITTSEEEALKTLAKSYMDLSENQLHQAITTGEVIEVIYEKTNSKSSA